MSTIANTNSSTAEVAIANVKSAMDATLNAVKQANASVEWYNNTAQAVYDCIFNSVAGDCSQGNLLRRTDQESCYSKCLEYPTIKEIESLDIAEEICRDFSDRLENLHTNECLIQLNKDESAYREPEDAETQNPNSVGFIPSGTCLIVWQRWKDTNIVFVQTPDRKNFWIDSSDVTHLGDKDCKNLDIRTPENWISDSPQPSSTGTGLFPIFGEGACQVPAAVGSKGYDLDEHRARDIIPIGAFITPDSAYYNPDWDKDPRTSSYNKIYAVATGTIEKITNYQYILRSTIDGQEIWFQYTHADITHVGPVHAGTMIGSMASHQDDATALNETHLDFAIIPQPYIVGGEIDPVDSNYFPNILLTAEDIIRQARTCRGER